MQARKILFRNFSLRYALRPVICIGLVSNVTGYEDSNGHSVLVVEGDSTPRPSSYILIQVTEKCWEGSKDKIYYESSVSIPISFSYNWGSKTLATNPYPDIS